VPSLEKLAAVIERGPGPDRAHDPAESDGLMAARALAMIRPDHPLGAPVLGRWAAAGVSEARIGLWYAGPSARGQVPVLLGVLADPAVGDEEKGETLVALALVGGLDAHYARAGKDALRASRPLLDHPEELMRWAAAQALGTAGPAAAADVTPKLAKMLEAALADPARARDGEWACYALARVASAGGPGGAEAGLRRALADDRELTRIWASLALAKADPRDAEARAGLAAGVGRLAGKVSAELSQSSAGEVRLYVAPLCDAVTTLGADGAWEAHRVLRRLTLADQRADFREAAGRAMRAVAGRDDAREE